MHCGVGKPLAGSVTVPPADVDSPSQPPFMRTDSPTLQMGAGSPRRPARPAPQSFQGWSPLRPVLLPPEPPSPLLTRLANSCALLGTQGLLPQGACQLGIRCMRR